MIVYFGPFKGPFLIKCGLNYFDSVVFGPFKGLFFIFGWFSFVPFKEDYGPYLIKYENDNFDSIVFGSFKDKSRPFLIK